VQEHQEVVIQGHLEVDIQELVLLLVVDIQVQVHLQVVDIQEQELLLAVDTQVQEVQDIQELLLQLIPK